MEYRNRLVESKVTLVILHVDLVGSAQLSATIPLDRLTTIIQTFTQEMSIQVSQYGGYVLKYVGDAVLAFFITGSADSIDDSTKQQQDPQYLPCINAINCAKSMIKLGKASIQFLISIIILRWAYA